MWLPRPQPEGDFNSLTGKFKIMMYEDFKSQILSAVAMHGFPAGEIDMGDAASILLIFFMG